MVKLIALNAKKGAYLEVSYCNMIVLDFGMPNTWSSF